MKEATARMLIDSGVVEDVTAYCAIAGAGAWELWLSGQRVPVHVGERLETARGEIRFFACVDTLVAYVRRLGWTKKITVDTFV